MTSPPKHPVSFCPLCEQPVSEEMRNELTSLYLRKGPLLVLYKLIHASPGILNHEYFGISQMSLYIYISSIRRALRETGSPWKIIGKQSEGYYAKKD